MSYPAERRTLARPARPWSPFGLALAFAVAAFLFACHTDPAPGKVYMDVEVDATWLGADSVRVVLMDLQGNPLDTLYEGKPASAADLKRLEAQGYQGGTVRIGLYMIKDGKVIRWETRDYNGQIGAVIGRDSLPLVKPPDTTRPVDTTKPPVTRALDLKPDAVTLYLGGEKRTLTAHPESAWAGKALSWSVFAQGIVSVSPSGELTAMAVGDADVIGEGQGGAKDTVKVKVVRDPPELEVGAPDTAILTKTTLAFKVRVTQAYGVIASFAWDLDGDGTYEDSASGFPAGQVEFATTPRTYDNTADIRLRFHVRDGEGNVDTASKRLQVVGTIPVITGLAARTVITIKDTVRFSAEATVSARTLAAYAWDYDGDGKTDDSAALAKASETLSGTRRYDDSGTFKVRLKVYDAAGTVQTATAEVRVERDPPRADAGANQTVETGATVSLKGTGFDSLGRIALREWKIGTAAFKVGEDTISFAAPAMAGTVTCLFKVTDDDGLSDTDTVVVAVVLKSAPALAWKARDTVVSIKDPVTFRVTVDARGAALKSFAWDWDNDGTADSSGTLSGRSAVLTATRSWPTAGTPTVGLTVTDQDNLSVTGSEKVTVKTYAPRVSAGADTAVTVSTLIQLHGSDQDTVGTIVRREWKIGAAAYATVGKGDTSFTAPASAAPLVCSYKVTDDDGNVVTDEVTVTVALSSNADLSGLVVAPLTGPALALDSAFLPGRTVYQAAQVANTVAAVKVTPTVATAGATVSVNGSLLVAGEAANVPILVGANPIAIEVTAPNGTTRKTYQVTAYRGAPTEAQLSFAIISTLADTGAQLWSKYSNLWHTLAPPVKQLGRGRYTIDFYGLGGTNERAVNVQVNAYGNGDSAYCKTESAVKGSGVLVTVGCFTPGGQRKNAWPQVLVQMPRAHETGANALVRVDQPARAGTYLANPELSFNSAAKPIHVTRTAAGAYTLLFKNLVANAATALGNMAVTPYGAGSERCNVVTYGAVGNDLQATVRCFTPAGISADAAFDAAVTFPLTGTSTGKTAGLTQGFGLFDIVASSQGVPDSPLMYNPAGNFNLTYVGVGEYGVDFDLMENGSPPLGAPVGMATAYGLTTGGYCQVNSTTVYIQTASAMVKCHGPDGKPVNTKFMLWFMR